jgi:hypothetical protein
MQTIPRHKTKQCPCNLSITKQIKYFLPFLKKISKAKDIKTKRKLFKSAPECLTKFISECSGALLRRDIELPITKYKRLKPFKKSLLYLSDTKHKLKNKTNAFLKKRGGQLFSLLPILGTLLANTVLPLIVDKFKSK